jgi:predicted amidohydrolase
LFRIGCLQLELGTDDNFERIRAEMRAAKSVFKKLDMIVAAELATYGFDPARAEALPGPTERKYSELARELGVWLIPGSLYERAGDKVHNTASVINPQGEVVRRYRKLFPWQPFESLSSPGDDFVVFDVAGAGRIGLSICYDSSFPEVARGLAWLGAEAIINITATYTHDRAIENVVSQANAFANHCYVLDVCNAGQLGNGRSIMVGPDGLVIYQAGSGHEIIPMAIEFETARTARREGAFGLSPHLANLARSKVKFPQFGGHRIAGAPACFDPDSDAAPTISIGKDA